jgi:hypothetical protein
MPIIGERQRLTRKNVQSAPAAAGVYALYVEGELAFYGAARGGEHTIRSRLSEHLAGRGSPSGLKAAMFSYEVTRFPMSRECALLEEHRRTNHTLPPFNQAQ